MAGSPAALADFAHDAFISYATDADYALARDLEAFLEAFHELPTPTNLPLRPIQIWRDGSGIRRTPTDGSATLQERLIEAITASKFLIVLWSEAARHSRWVELEISNFIAARGAASVLLCLTDAPHPGRDAQTILSADLIRHDLHKFAWYDLRGFSPPKGAHGLRDYEEECIRLAADVSGVAAGEIQPLWWRNKARLEQKRADEERETRERIELAELDARLQAGEAWFERALVHFERGEHHHACERLLEAVALAPPLHIPPHFEPTIGREGWTRRAWALAGCVAASLPKRVASYSGLPGRSRDGPFIWFDEGRRCLSVDSTLSVYDLSGGTAVLEWSITQTDFYGETDESPDEDRLRRGAIRATAARAAPRLLLIGDDGRVDTVDSRDGGRVRITPDTACDTSLTVALGCLDDTGDLLLLAQTLPNDEGIAISVREWPGDIKQAEFTIGKGETGEPRWIGLSADGKQAGLLTSGAFYIFDLNGKMSQRLPAGGIGPQVVSPDFRFLGASSYDLWQLSEWIGEEMLAPWERPLSSGPTIKRTVMEGALGFITSIVFAADASIAFTLSTGGDVIAWETRRPVLSRGISMHGMVMSQSFDDSNREGPLSKLSGLGAVDAIACHPQSPSDLMVAIGDRLEHWRFVRSDKPLPTKFPDQPAARSVCDDTTGRIAVGLEDGSVHVLTGDHCQLLTLGAAVFDLAFFQSKLAACGGYEVHIWRLPEPRELHVARFNAHVLSVAFTAGGATLLVGLSNGVLWAWSPPDRPVRLAALGVGALRRIQVSVDGKIALIAGEADPKGGSFRSGAALWSVRDERLLWSTDRACNAHDAALSRDGRLALIGGMMGAVILDAESGAALAAMQPPQLDPTKPDHVTAVCFGPDDRTAFLGMWDGSVVVADILSDRLFYTFKAHEKYVSSLAVDRVSGRLITTSPYQHGREKIAVWRAFAPEFFAGNPIGEHWTDQLAGDFCNRYGAFRLRPASPTSWSEEDRLDKSEDPVGQARSLIDEDPELASDLLAKAALTGLQEQLTPNELIIASTNLIEAQNEELAMELLLAAAQAGERRAHRLIGQLKIGPDGHGWREALAHFERAATAGDAEAAFLIGHYHENIDRGLISETNWCAFASPDFTGDGLLASAEEAARWYGQAADWGMIEAMERLAELLKGGKGIPADPNKSRSLLEIVASARSKPGHL